MFCQHGKSRTLHHRGCHLFINSLQILFACASAQGKRSLICGLHQLVRSCLELRDKRLNVLGGFEQRVHCFVSRFESGLAKGVPAKFTIIACSATILNLHLKQMKTLRKTMVNVSSFRAPFVAMQPWQCLPATIWTLLERVWRRGALEYHFPSHSHTNTGSHAMPERITLIHPQSHPLTHLTSVRLPMLSHTSGCSQAVLMEAPKHETFLTPFANFAAQCE